MADDKQEAWNKIKDGAKAVGDLAGETAKQWKEKAEETAKILGEPGNSPKKKATWKKIGMAAALLAIIFILAGLLSGPSLSCDDSEVRETVAGLVKESIQKIANNLGQLAMIFEDPSTSQISDELKQLKNLKVDIDKIQETSMNKQAKRCSCSAEATIRLGDLKETQRIRYQVSDTDKGIYVELDPVSLFRQ